MFSKHRNFFLLLFSLSAIVIFGMSAHAQSDESRADLAIDSLVINPASIRYTMRNVGTARYSGQVTRTTAWLNADGAVAATRDSLMYINLGQGEFRTIDVASVNYPPAPTSATRLRVSFAPSMTELNANNNSTEAVRPLPDLVIQNPTFTWNSGSFTVRNIGTSSWTGRYHVRYEWLDIANTILETINGISSNITVLPDATNIHILPVSFMTSIPTGAVKVRLTVDVDAEVTELDESNNSIEVNRIFPVVDLRPYTAFLYTDSLNYSIINIGDDDFNQNLGVSLTWLDSAGNELASESISNDVTLRPGYSGGDTFTVDSEFVRQPPSGGVRMRINIDPNNNFNESDETNNSITINRRLPDLEVTNFGLSSEGLFFRIRNNGEDDYVGTVPVRLVWLGSGDNELGVSELTYSVNLSGSNASDNDLSPVFNLASPFVLTVPAGAQRFRIAINSNQAIAESRYDNNSVDIVPAFPDFTVSNPLLNDDSLTFTINNVSDRGANARYNRSLDIAFTWLDGAGASVSDSNITRSVDIRAGQGSEISITSPGVINPPTRGVRLRITVNQQHTVNEIIFDNNSAEVMRSTFPDALVENALINPDNENLSFTLRNVGVEYIGGLVTIRYAWLDSSGTEITSNSESVMTDLDPGESMALTRYNYYIVDPPEAARQLKVEFNPLRGAAMVESNYDNNTTQTIRPLPDLTLSSPYLNQASVNFRVNNVGTFRHDQMTNLRFAWLNSSGEELNNHSYTRVITVPPGGNQAINIALSTLGDYVTDYPTGAVRLKITINSNQGRPELNFDNNTVEVAPSFPDFIIESAILSSSGASMVIKNNGLSARSGIIRYQLQWLDRNRNPIGGASPVLTIPSTTLAAGVSMTFSDPGPYALLSGGNREFLRATINPENLFLESNYTNNNFEMTRPLSDLSVLIDNLGETTVGYTISNSGHWTIAESAEVVLEWIDANGIVVGSLSRPTRLDLGINGSMSTSYIGPFITAPTNNSVALRIVINPSHAIVEEDYNNNVSAEFSRSIPDLSIENPLLTTSSLSYTVTNIGTRRVDALIRTLYEWINDAGVVLDSRSNQRSTRLDPGQSYISISGSYSTALQNFIMVPSSPGAHLRVTLDYDDRLDEINETNNSVTVFMVSENTTGEDLANEDEEEVAREVAAAAEGEESEEGSGGTNQGAKLNRPLILPDSIFYGLKNFTQEVRAVFTFDDEKRAALRLQYANRRILESNFLIEDGKIQQAAKNLERYQRDIRKAQEAIVEMSKSESRDNKNPPGMMSDSIKLSNRLLGDEIRHQMLLGRFERRANELNDLASMKSVSIVRQETADSSSEIISKLPKRMSQNTLHAVLNQDGTPFRTFRNLEVLQTLKENAPVVAKNVIDGVALMQEQKFADNLASSTPQLRVRFASYVDKAGGNEVLYLKANDAIAVKIQDEEVKKDLSQSQEKILSRIEQQIKTAAAIGDETKQEVQKAVFKHFKDGTESDQRVKKMIEKPISPKQKTEEKSQLPISDKIKEAEIVPEKKVVPPPIRDKKETIKTPEQVKSPELPKQTEVLPTKSIAPIVVKPVEPTKSLIVEPTSSKLENIVKPIEPAKPTETEKVIEPVKIIEPIKEVAPVIETAPVKSAPIIVEPIKVIQPISVTEPAKEVVTATTSAEKTVTQIAVPTVSYPSSATIKISNSIFSPSSVTVSVGAKITIINSDKVVHALSGSISSPSIKPGSSVAITAPTKPGIYNYSCFYHSSMRGVIIVK